MLPSCGQRSAIVAKAILLPTMKVFYALAIIYIRKSRQVRRQIVQIKSASSNLRTFVFAVFAVFVAWPGMGGISEVKCQCKNLEVRRERAYFSVTIISGYKI